MTNRRVKWLPAAWRVKGGCPPDWRERRNRAIEGAGGFCERRGKRCQVVCDAVDWFDGVWLAVCPHCREEADSHATLF